jgi:hypothetical protein
LGYQVIPDEGRSLTLSDAIVRTLLGFLAVAMAWFAPYVLPDRKKGKFWLDSIFNTRAVTLQ